MVRPPLPLIAGFRSDVTLIRVQGRAVSQREFLCNALALAQRLPDHRATINLCRDRYRFMLGFCASLLRGCPALLPPNRQRQTIREIAADYPGSLCLLDSDEDFGVAAVTLDGGHDSVDGEPELPIIAADQVAAIAFTSGSTGKPVANEKRWFTLCGTATMLARRFAPADRPRPTIVATVPSQHMYGLEMTVMMALQGGCAIDAGHPFHAGDVAAALAAQLPPRLLVTTPIHLRHLQASGVAMPPVERVISATAPLSIELASAAEDLFGGTVEEIFGCTEAGSIATRHSASDDNWQLLDGMTMSSEPGEIRVAGPQLACATVLQDHMELLGPDRFRFLGRAADMINVGGKRASLADLTRKLQDLDDVSDGVVFMPAGEGIERPAALVVSDLSEREITRQLARRIDPVLLPRPLHKVRQIPRNETGKATVGLLQEALERCREHES